MVSLFVRGAALVTAISLGAPFTCRRCWLSRRSSGHSSIADRCSLFRTGAKPNLKPSLSTLVSNDWRQSVAHSLVCTAALDTSVHECFAFVKSAVTESGMGSFLMTMQNWKCVCEFRMAWWERTVSARHDATVSARHDATVSARHVQVDSQDDALYIAIRTAKGPRMIYSASRLYGRVKSSESVWYIDNDEIVLSLKKMDDDVKWPSLEEAWASLTVGVSQLLKGTSVTYTLLAAPLRSIGLLQRSLLLVSSM